MGMLIWPSGLKALSLIKNCRKPMRT